MPLIYKDFSRGVESYILSMPPFFSLSGKELILMISSNTCQMIVCNSAPSVYLYSFVNSARPIPVQEHRAFGERSFL
ncbi:MAG: hypothetical protein UY62_C0037G0012 [Parcubacteria group bacterium GW2011_GWF2_50_9]|nr:MAG: hypothetical protein UY62_C0037G0012 [Parcubacteria group bacterium GW2011_GWF2_50_9]